MLLFYNIYVNKITNLRGRVRFPTGGKVRDPLLFWCVQRENKVADMVQFHNRQ